MPPPPLDPKPLTRRPAARDNNAMSLRHYFWAAVLFLFAATSAFAGSHRLILSGGRLWLHARNSPLQDILSDLGSYNVDVKIDPSINPEITVSLSNRDLQRGMAVLLKDLDYVLVWKVLDGPVGRVTRLGEVQVYWSGKSGSVRSLGSKKGLTVVRDEKTGALVVKDEVLVRFRKGLSMADAQKALAAVGGELLEANRATGVYRVRLPKDSDLAQVMENLGKAPGVDKAEPNYAIKAPSLVPGKSLKTPAPPPGDYSMPEGAAKVAVLDTGLSNWGDLEGLVVGSLDAVDPGQVMSDSLGHGTQMALLASGSVLPEGAKDGLDMENPIIPIRTFDNQGLTSNFAIMTAMEYAVDQGADVISCSWATDVDSSFMEEAMLYGRQSGAYIVAAAGNEPTGKPVYPAAYDSVIGVGALKPIGITWEKSNYGSHVMLLAPGFADLPVGYQGEPGTYAGTSIATAFVSGVLAHALTQNPEASQEKILQVLAESF